MSRLRLELFFTPRQAVLFWLQERRDVGAGKYWEKALSNPMSARTRVAKTVTDALRENI